MKNKNCNFTIRYFTSDSTCGRSQTTKHEDLPLVKSYYILRDFIVHFMSTSSPISTTSTNTDVMNIIYKENNSLSVSLLNLWCELKYNYARQK